MEIYGAVATECIYGTVLPVAQERILLARHHVVLRDTRTGPVFAGDTFGLSYRELDRIPNSL